ncbi:hypothetical protein PGQ11_007815 [Apiospora arundinis]|uniref:Uncharacterized protein n=1 Tax=Apiospora arundinis TaxID=335852 RepID=A0ABR2IWL6_9PEZI
MTVAVLGHLALPLVDGGHAKLAVAAGETLRRMPSSRSGHSVEVVEDALMNADGLAHAPRVPQQGREPVGQIQGLPVGAATRLAHVVVHGAAELDGLVHVRLPRVRLDQQRADAQHHRRRPVALHLAGLPERQQMGEMSYLQLFVVFLFVQEMDQAGHIVEAQGDGPDTRFLHGGHNELQRSLAGALHLLLETGIRPLAGRDPVAREQLRQAIPVDQTLVPWHIKMQIRERIELGTR